MARRTPRNEDKARAVRRRAAKEIAERADTPAPGDRTSKGKTVARRPTGRPTILTENLEDTITGYLAGGRSITAAAHLSGISPGTYYDWRRRGEEARLHLDATGELPDTEAPFLQFAERTADARAQAEDRATGVIMKSMDGGSLVSEKPLLSIDGAPLFDPDGNILMERHYSTPDGRLAIQFLQRSRPGDWAQSAASKVEVTGAGGGPVKHEHSVEQIDTLSARIAEIAARQAEDERTWDGHQVIEGSVVDDEPDQESDGPLDATDTLGNE